MTVKFCAMAGFSGWKTSEAETALSDAEGEICTMRAAVGCMMVGYWMVLVWMS